MKNRNQTTLHYFQEAKRYYNNAKGILRSAKIEFVIDKFSKSIKKTWRVLPEEVK